MIYDICVVGLGYIGLPTAAVFARAGKKVLGVDLNQNAVDAVNSGRVHIVEPGLEDIVRETVATGSLTASSECQMADSFILAVPTPIQQDKSADISFVLQAARDIASKLRPGNLVILESTSPPGTTRRLAEVVGEERPDLVDEDGLMLIHFVHAPERVLPGHAMREIVENDRVLGGLTIQASELAAELYRVFVRGEILVTDATTAELVKLSENAFRDVNIAFANELSMISNEIEVNVWEVIRLANHHPRVNIMQPGPGVGGHCIAVDPWFIADAAPSSSNLIKVARKINDSKPQLVVKAVREAIKSCESDCKVSLLGLSFKKNIDDLRGSPALEIAIELVRSDASTKFSIVEPHISKLPSDFDGMPNVVLSDSASINVADVVVLLVDHDKFSSVSPNELSGRQVIDTRGMWTEH